MLLSMTGFGDARYQDEAITIAVEIRSVNNRYLKISTKYPEAYAGRESDIEKLVREKIKRGTITGTLRVDHLDKTNRFVLNEEALQSYFSQIREIAEKIGIPESPHLSNFLLLPGVIAETAATSNGKDNSWPHVESTFRKAIEKLNHFRAAEGQSMEKELTTNCAVISEQLGQIQKLAPQVVSTYRDRILERVRDLLQQTDVAVKSSDLIREVSIFSDRCDINEEITRLHSHLDQFGSFLKQTESQGRKLEFLTQEMFREVNTIGSKANNVEIAHCVVEMKASVEKMREILQNVE